MSTLTSKQISKTYKQLLKVNDPSDLDPSWKQLHKDAFGVVHSQIDKIANGFSTVSAKNPSGEDWESIIAVAVNKIQKRKWNRGPEWDRAEKFWGDWQDQGMKLGQEFIKKLKVSNFIRAKLNCTTRTSKIFKFKPHYDWDGDCNVAIFYINSNNGYTQFETGEKVESVENRLVTFDNKIEHFGTTPTNSQTRIVLNMCY